jgi:hypothetical protein
VPAGIAAYFVLIQAQLTSQATEASDTVVSAPPLRSTSLTLPQCLDGRSRNAQ